VLIPGRLKLESEKDAGKTLLIIGGGVGSIATLLSKQVAGLKVVASGSRDASRDWCIALGADAIVNHHEDMTAALDE